MTLDLVAITLTGLVGVIFTAVSLVRSYLLRRLFNRWHS